MWSYLTDFQTSCGGTSNVIVLRSTFWYASMHGRMKNMPEMESDLNWYCQHNIFPISSPAENNSKSHPCCQMREKREKQKTIQRVIISSLPGPFEPPWSNRPKRKITARSYSWTTWKELHMLLLDEVDIEDMGIGWAAREGIMMRTRNHLKTDAETKGESDEDNQPG